jgi:hypothetical protein
MLNVRTAHKKPSEFAAITYRIEDRLPSARFGAKAIGLPDRLTMTTVPVKGVNKWVRILSRATAR